MNQLKKKSVIIGLGIVLIFTVILGISVARAYSSDTICGGVEAGGVSIANLTKEEAADKLYEKLGGVTFDKPVQLVLGDVEKSVIPADFLAAYDYKKTAEKAMLYGHEGTFVQRLGQSVRTFFVKKKIDMEITYDETAYADILKELMKGVGEKVQEHTWEIQGDKLVIKNGHPGLLPDETSVSEAILSAIQKGKYDKKIVFKKENRTPSPIDADILWETICAEAANASYSIENGKVIMQPHALGISFNKETAKQILDAHTAYGETFEIPLQIQEPEVTLADIEAKLFAEVIGEYTTVFKTSDIGRSKNIALASNKINGTILAPGEVFSYNDVVGERSYSEGFQTAKVYVNGETVDGIGGGICQVSSTLFNAVVFANLEIVERVNHQLTVSYVPLGRDATVDYGNIDFRFKNTTGYPIKIVATADEGKMYTAIFGYKEDKTEEVSFETVTIGHTAPPEKKVDDPTLPLGEEKVESEGTSGYVVDTYKVIKKHGREDERVYLCRSTYRGNLRVIHVGTGEAVPSPSPDPLETEQPPEVEVPVETTPLPTMGQLDTPSALETILPSLVTSAPSQTPPPVEEIPTETPDETEEISAPTL